MGLINDIRAFLANRGGVTWYSAGIDSPMVLNMDAESIYRTQPNLQSVISFLAENMASLPIKVYDRKADNDRERITDSPAALFLRQPNPDQTWYEFACESFSDYNLFGQTIWLTLEDDTMPSGWQARRIPPSWVMGYHGASAFAPDSIDIMSGCGSSAINVPSDHLIIFHNYNPAAPYAHVSPIEALRSTLLEQIESERYRTQMWHRGGRFNAYIARPKDVLPWSTEAAERFKRDLSETWVGDAGSNAGRIPVLEDGMEVKQAQFNAHEAQWAEAKKFSREEIAAVYHVNPSLIWHTDSQTYASAKDNARALYSETLAPRLAMFEQRINAFLLPRIGASDSEYAEFDLQAKLRGSFEEQAQVIQTSVGGPWLTRNEARARFNLPAIDGGDELIVPLNVITGGQASPTDTAPREYAAEPQRKDAPKGVRIKSHPSDEQAQTVRDALEAFIDRQKRSILPKIGAGNPDWWDEERWDTELADDLYPIMLEMSTDAGRAHMREMGIDPDEYIEERTEAYIRKMAEGRALTINASTRKEVSKEIDDDGDPSAAFDRQKSDKSELSSRAIACAVLGFAAMECVRQAMDNHRVIDATKTWVVTSANPRPSHAVMDGETVPFYAPFSNGAEWPGDSSALDVADVANCQCEVEISIP